LAAKELADTGCPSPDIADALTGGQSLMSSAIEVVVENYLPASLERQSFQQNDKI
jgi:hypothetical protein